MNVELQNRGQLVKEYTSRINRVMDYIEKNMDKKLTLDELADVALFSRFHFHRIFYALVGETLFQFIQRIRLERAACRLVGDPNASVTEVALDYGFSSSATFARSFKEAFKMSATEWRKSKNKGDIKVNRNISDSNSNISKIDSNFCEEIFSSNMYIEYNNTSQIWRITMNDKEHKVEVKDIPDMSVAYLRYTGPYAGDSELFARLTNQLFQWAGPRDLVKVPDTKYLIMYHDDHNITDESKLRTSICITVPDDTQVDGEIGKMVIKGGKYAMGRFVLGPQDFEEAWQWMYQTWLPQSGYVPCDNPPYEYYPNAHDEEERKSGQFTVDICIPVKPM